MPAEIITLPMWDAVFGKDAKDREKKPGREVISTVANSGGWTKYLSPFVLGPCDLYWHYRARNMENAWQFSKVYAQHVGPDGGPTNVWTAWATHGWIDYKPHRYPMGKGAVPKYSWWAGEALTYIDARKVIYGPLYAEAVMKTDAWPIMKDLYKHKKQIILLDWDARDTRVTGESMTDVLHNPTKKMGHAFVLKMLLTKDPALKHMQLR